jgi:hypothetical protein
VVPLGRDATGELARFLRTRDRFAEALDLYEGVASHPDCEVERRVQAWYAAALCAESAGDRPRGRKAMERIVEDLADDPKWERAVRKAKEWLREHP